MRRHLPVEDGALCLFGAIRSESHRDLRLEMSAMAVLLEAICRQFGDRFDSVPAFNDAPAHRDGRVPMRILRQAADLAHARGFSPRPEHLARAPPAGYGPGPPARAPPPTTPAPIQGRGRTTGFPLG
ncbi:DUF6197 family protein [Streptomyces sindenensis]|uniref:DUF6197 family protein n=1 Tax=Streptomyces sindenensis TaxID=67363 RepID=UPI003663606D